MDELEERNMKIIEMRRRGMTTLDIAKIFDMSRQQVGSITKGEPYVSYRTRTIGKYIYDYVREHAAAPSIREIAEYAIDGIMLSTSVVSIHLKTLAKLGLIELTDDPIARGISIPFVTILLDDFEDILADVVYDKKSNEHPV